MLRAFCKPIQDFSGLVNIARYELSKFHGRAEIVCGPITSGGLGSVEKNLAVFNSAIQGLIIQGRPVFNQMPYEDALFRLQAEHERRHGRHPEDKSYNPVVLEEFYLPLFQTRGFSRAWFLPHWRTSKGATWERNTLGGLGVCIVELSEDQLANLLALS